MIEFPLPTILVDRLVMAALAEDLGDAGDVTSLAVIAAEARSTAVLAARKAGTIAGIALAHSAFRLSDPSVSVEVVKSDGDNVKAGDAILRVEGLSRGILSAERVALNYLGHLSGIASATHALVEAVAGTGTKIACTRKTTPGLRALEKHAVRCGGGVNHRFGLYDAVMIKDNHIQAAGSITKALRKAKAAIGHMVKIEIEVDSLEQLDEVLREGADVVLLDNMTPETLREAVRRAKGKTILEASGNITLETVKKVAETGVNVISSGWITHSAPNLDLGLDFVAS